MKKNTLIQKPSGGVECRICGLNFLPELESNREEHEALHRSLIWGGLPLDVREFLKSFGWAVAHDDGGLERLKDHFSSEIGRRAVVFGYWTRTVANGFPENDFQDFMEAYFAFVDANVDGDEQARKKASEAIKHWEKYG